MIRELSITVGTHGHVSALFARPDDAQALYVLGHGAGAGMRHAFLESIAERLHQRGIATLRYQFPFMENRGGRPDPTAVLLATVRAAVKAGKTEAPGLPIFAGGKSMGGRMTSLEVANAGPDELEGLVFLGFPLHPPKRPSDQRAQHLAQVNLPMLFLQGTRDELADMTLMEPVCAALGTRAQLHIISGADHGFHVLKRSGRNDLQVLDELADVSTGWMLSRAGSAV